MTLVAMTDPRQLLHVLADEADPAAICGFRPDQDWLSVRNTPDLPVHVPVCNGCISVAA